MARQKDVIGEREHITPSHQWYRTIGNNRYRFRVAKAFNFTTIRCSVQNLGNPPTWVDIRSWKIDFKKGEFTTYSPDPRNPKYLSVPNLQHTWASKL